MWNPVYSPTLNLPEDTAQSPTKVVRITFVTAGSRYWGGRIHCPRRRMPLSLAHDRKPLRGLNETGTPLRQGRNSTTPTWNT